MDSLEGTIVFIGDSITESGRWGDSEQVGYGYVRLIRDYLITAYPNRSFDIVNRGVSGNRIPDLLARWERDVIALQPDVVSISIGINDVWRQLDHLEKEQVYPDEFERIYAELARKTKEKTNAQLIFMEPTIIGEEIDIGRECKVKTVCGSSTKNSAEVSRYFSAYSSSISRLFTNASAISVND